MNPAFTGRLANFIVCDAGARITPSLRQQAVRAILDTLAVTVAGGADPGVERLEASLDPVPTARARSPWTGRAYLPADAALLYGMASHMYDYDDVSMLAVCHPSAPVLSALMAIQTGGLAPADASGQEFIEAFTIGTEVLIRLGQAMGFRHYELGFHATSTLGTVGACAAACRLLRLDAAQTAHALAIAASMASGLRKNFGSMVKPLHVGLAAAGAVRATRMAQAGVEGATEIFEGNGYLQAFSGGATDQFPASGLVLGQPFALEHPGFEQKRYPCCYLLHKMIEATLRLRRESGITLAQLERAHVHMPKGGTKPLIHPVPATGLHGKFSAPYAVIASLADGRIDLASFTDDAVRRPQVQSRLADVTVVEDTRDTVVPGSDLGREPVTVTLTLRDGLRLEHTVLPSPGSPDDPLTLAQLRQKWVDCVTHGLACLDPETAAGHFDQGLLLDQATSAGSWLQGLLHRA